MEIDNKLMLILRKEIFDCKSDVELYNILLSFTKNKMLYGEIINLDTLFPTNTDNEKRNEILKKWKTKTHDTLLELIRIKYFEINNFRISYLFNDKELFCKSKIEPEIQEDKFQLIIN